MLKALIIAVVAYAAIAAAMYTLQRSFIYIRDELRTAPVDAGIAGVSERILETPDGERLIGWYGQGEPGRPAILYFHGNAGTLELRSDRMRHYLGRGHPMLMMAYRGYSGSTGSPTEANLIADATLAYDTLVADGVRPHDIIVYGESLGAAVAIQLAAKKAVGAVILDSPFTSLVEMARLSYPWLPVGLLLKDRYMSIDYIEAVRAPLIILHGESDEVTPVAMARALFARANEPKELVTLPGAGHSNHVEFGSYGKIDAWIDRIWRREAR